MTLRIALIQHACSESSSANLDQSIKMMEEAADQGAHLIVTQELFQSLYFPQVENEQHFSLAQPIPGPTTNRLCEVAAQRGVEISASLFEKRADGLYHNTSVMINVKGNIIGRYRKMHIPDDPGFYEKYYFTPGDAPHATVDRHEGRPELLGHGWQVQQTSRAVTGMLVCWDQWFPEAARLTALHGAQVLLYPTAIGWIPADPDPATRAAQRDAWMTMQRSHAIANGVFVAAINRIGTEGELTFWGSSFIADPAGRVIAEAPQDEPAILIADLDLSQIERQRQAWPFLRDRRIDAYAGLLRRYID